MNDSRTEKEVTDQADAHLGRQVPPVDRIGPYDETQLTLEARALYRSLFRLPAPDDIIEAYIVAHRVVFKDRLGLEERAPYSSGTDLEVPDPCTKAREQQAKLIRKAILTGANLDAVERAMRLRGKENLLTQKFHVMLYLAETSPGHYPVFHNDTVRRLDAWATLSYQTLRLVPLIILGMFTVWRLRDA